MTRIEQKAMQMLRVANTSVRASRIAFGTAALHHLRRAEREALLLEAVGNGITHFDTAPYYGFGIAERALATLSKRPDVTIATKVGLYPPGGADAHAGVVSARKIFGRLVPRMSRPIVDLEVSRARESLRGSLRRMRRDRVDILFLHEPRPELVATDEWMRWLESEGDRVGAVGLAGEPERILPFVNVNSPLAAVIQTRDSFQLQEAAPLRAAGHSPHITYGHLGKGYPVRDAHERLARAVACFPETILLVSTRRRERVRLLARSVEVTCQNTRPR